MIRVIIYKISRKLFGRETLDKRNRKRLIDDNFSIISSNCNGGVILHDLGLRFNSPFVNLWISPKDFIKLLNNLDEYLSYKLLPLQKTELNYPVGILGDIIIHFQHYSSFSEAKEKWEQRLKRIVRNNIFIMFTDRDGCTYEDLLLFDKLDYPNKVVFVCRPYKDIKSSFYIRGFEREKSVGVLTEYRNSNLGRRYIDDFDYVRWFNGENIVTT